MTLKPVHHPLCRWSDDTPCHCGLGDLYATVADLKRRAKLATRYLRSVSTGSFANGSLVVAAIHALDTSEPLPAKPRANARNGARR